MPMIVFLISFPLAYMWIGAWLATYLKVIDRFGQDTAYVFTTVWFLIPVVVVLLVVWQTWRENRAFEASRPKPPREPTAEEQAESNRRFLAAMDRIRAMSDAFCENMLEYDRQKLRCYEEMWNLEKSR